jgi:uncharacterized membrane protein YoaK (UPF0700 family)
MTRSAQSPRPSAALGSTAHSIRHPLVRALLVLTFTTGLVDAVSYLGLGRVFTANMTGNVVMLGFGIAGSGGLPVVSPLVSLAAFLLGSGCGGVLARRIGERRPEHIARALAIEVALIALTAALAAAFDIRVNAFSGDALVALLGFAMGVRNATVRRLAVPDLTTTVLTMTLTSLAAESRPAGASGDGTVRKLGAVVAMLSGALAGALLLKSSVTLPLVAAAALALLTWLVYVPAARRGP